ncbi:dienelactone hydrolase [Phlyctema vagabunda]|uniref:Dienelactone hydrolase n=1 Tax=Phlyctema vagabunda TaxID=108571 RepID=A0ABR4P233_9HELO
MATRRDEDQDPDQARIQIPESACCCPSPAPPVVGAGSGSDGRDEYAKEYVPRGTYVDIGGLKTYVTGASPVTATKAIVVIYDIFGFSPQLLQGLDGIGATDYPKDGDGEEYVLFVPDLFEGCPAEVSWYPPETPEQIQKLGAWYATRTPQMAVDRVPGFLVDVERAYGKKSWGVLGYCWGGKATSLLASTSPPQIAFKIVVQCHPALIEPAEALSITIPTLVLASKDEDLAVVQSYVENLACNGEQKALHVFDDMVHGWLSARGDLEDVRVRDEWVRGYGLINEFLKSWF